MLTRLKTAPCPLSLYGFGVNLQYNLAQQAETDVAPHIVSIRSVSCHSVWLGDFDDAFTQIYWGIMGPQKAKLEEQLDAN